MTEEIIQLSERLLKYNHLFYSNYLAAREENIRNDFENIVKPFADEVKVVNDKWSRILKIWIDENKPINFNKRQVESIHEQIERHSIHCFFAETSRKRFLDTHKTIEYFLTGIMKELKK